MDNSFWEVNFKQELRDDEGYPYDKKHGPAFFSTEEECMAYVLAQKHMKITNIEITRRYLGTWKSKITLNESKEKEED